MRRPTIALVCALVCTTALSRAAHAQASSIVVEVWIGERPSDADDNFAFVYDKLTSAGARVGVAGVGKAYEQKVSRPGRAADDDVIKQASTLLGSGTTAWLSAEFEDAVGKFSQALAILDRAREAVAEDDELRTKLFKGLVGLAVSHLKLGDQDQAKAVMADIVRAFPDRDVTLREFGSDASKLHAVVKASLTSQGRGTLSVTVDDSSVLIDVDELPSGAGSISGKQLLIGAHRVLVRKDGVSRVYDVDIRPDETTELEVVWGFDKALVTGPDFAGFSFPNERTRDRFLVPYCERLARALDATTVIVVTIDEDSGRRAATGAVYTVGSVERPLSGTVPLEPDRLRALGAFLAGDEDALTLPRSTAGSAFLPSWAMWTAIGVGTVAVAAGVQLIRIDGRGTCGVPNVTCPEVYATKPLGIGFMIGGAATVATAVVLRLWKREGPERDGMTSISVNVEDGVLVQIGGSF